MPRLAKHEILVSKLDLINREFPTRHSKPRSGAPISVFAGRPWRTVSNPVTLGGSILNLSSWKSQRITVSKAIVAWRLFGFWRIRASTYQR